MMIRMMMKTMYDYRALEFAAVNPGLWGEKYRFAYGLGFPTGFLVSGFIYPNIAPIVGASTILLPLFILL